MTLRDQPNFAKDLVHNATAEMWLFVAQNGPHSAKQLVEKAIQDWDFSNYLAQEALRYGLDKGFFRLGDGLRLEASHWWE